MKTIIPSTKTPAGRLCSASGVILIAFVLTSLVLAQRAQALSPAPDGGYPGLNTAEGQNALLGLTTGTADTAVGWFSLKSNTDGTFNTAVGAATLLSNVGNQSTGEGVNNTAIGAAALLFNTTGFDNTAVGAAGLLHNVDGSFNTATGVDALFFNTASGNTAIGSKALLNNTTGGTLGTTNGVDLGPNVAIGMEALESNTVSSANTAVGYQALHSFTSGIAGFPQLGLNTAVGFQALANTNGANGGSRNSGFGYQALFHNTDGFENVAIGDQALFGNETGFRNTAIGGGAGSSVTTADHVICIGASGANVSNSCYIGNIFGTFNTAQSAVVYIDPDGRLGTGPSARRFKKDIADMGAASEVLLSMRPVTFHFKTQDTEKAGREISQFGLIAEEVAEVNPDLILRDKEGEIYSVRYDAVNAMLLNEFLKEHKKVQQLEAASAQQRDDFEARIAELRKEIASVVARSRDQDEKIQKVSAQVELNKAVSRTVANK